jgi:hypothetical protein
VNSSSGNRMQPASGDHHPLMVTNVISGQALSG